MGKVSKSPLNCVVNVKLRQITDSGNSSELFYFTSEITGGSYSNWKLIDCTLNNVLHLNQETALKTVSLNKATEVS